MLIDAARVTSIASGLGCTAFTPHVFYRIAWRGAACQKTSENKACGSAAPPERCNVSPVAVRGAQAQGNLMSTQNPNQGGQQNQQPGQGGGQQGGGQEKPGQQNQQPGQQNQGGERRDDQKK